MVDKELTDNKLVTLPMQLRYGTAQTGRLGFKLRRTPTVAVLVSLFAKFSLIWGIAGFPYAGACKLKF